MTLPLCCYSVMDDKNYFIPRHGSPLFYPTDPQEGFQNSGGGLSRRKFLKRTGGATFSALLALGSERAAAKQSNNYDTVLSDPGSPPSTEIDPFAEKGIVCTWPIPKNFTGKWSYVSDPPTSASGVAYSKSTFSIKGKEDDEYYQFAWTSTIQHRCIHAKSHFLGKEFTAKVKQTCFILQFDYTLKFEFIGFAMDNPSSNQGTQIQDETENTRTKFNELVTGDEQVNGFYSSGSISRNIRDYASLAITVDDDDVHKIKHGLATLDGEQALAPKDDVDYKWKWLISPKEAAPTKSIQAKMTVKPQDDVANAAKALLKTLLISRGIAAPDLTGFKKAEAFEGYSSKIFKFKTQGPNPIDGWDCPAMIDGVDDDTNREEPV